MKTITIPLSAVETNFAMRAQYVFGQALAQFLEENGAVPGKPLGENMAIFITMMTKKEIDDLKKQPIEKQQEILKSSLPGGKHE